MPTPTLTPLLKVSFFLIKISSQLSNVVSPSSTKIFLIPTPNATILSCSFILSKFLGKKLYVFQFLFILCSLLVRPTFVLSSWKHSPEGPWNSRISSHFTQFNFLTSSNLSLGLSTPGLWRLWVVLFPPICMVPFHTCLSSLHLPCSFLSSSLSPSVSLFLLTVSSQPMPPLSFPVTPSETKSPVPSLATGCFSAKSSTLQVSSSPMISTTLPRVDTAQHYKPKLGVCLVATCLYLASLQHLQPSPSSSSSPLSIPIPPALYLASHLLSHLVDPVSPESLPRSFPVAPTPSASTQLFLTSALIAV